MRIPGAAFLLESAKLRLSGARSSQWGSADGGGNVDVVKGYCVPYLDAKLFRLATVDFEVVDNSYFWRVNRQFAGECVWFGIRYVPRDVGDCATRVYPHEVERKFHTYHPESEASFGLEDEEHSSLSVQPRARGEAFGALGGSVRYLWI